MELVRARENDFNRIKDFYYDLIDNTPEIDKHAQWKKGLHPDEEDIFSFIQNEEMYITGAAAVTNCQGSDYHDVDWEVKLSDEEVSVIHLLGVGPSFQGQGIANKLIDEIISLSRNQGKKSLRLDAIASNIPAQHMYTSKGFAYMGKQNLFAGNTGWIDFYFYEYAL